MKPQVIGLPKDLEGAKDLARRDKFQFQWWANWLVNVQNYREQKKGPEGGIDGITYFKNGVFGTGLVFVSIKGGEHVSPEMVRALSGTVDREAAELGLLVTLNPPTPNMKKEACALGLVKTAHGKLPKLQIATVEDLLNGLRPNLPPPYESIMEERLSKQVKRKDSKQIEFTFLLPGGKDGKPSRGEKVYPSERIAAQMFGS